MLEWKKVKIGDVCKINANPYSSKDNWDFVNYLDTGNITENKIDSIQNINLKIDKLPSRAKRKVKFNSIIYSTVRPIQKHFGFIKKYPENFLVSTGFAVIDVDENLVNAKFLYYYLKKDEVIQYLQTIAEHTTTAYPSIKPSDIAELEINIPDLETQKKIVSVLFVLDDKIELNNRINENLEKQAQAIYNKMFITTNNHRKTCRAEEYFDIAIGKTPPRKEHQWFTTNQTDIPWISISDMGENNVYISKSSEQLIKEAVDKFNIKIIPNNTVILSFKLTIGRVLITYGEMTSNEAIAHFKTDKTFINEYLYFYLKKFNYQTMGNTSSIATAVNSKIIKSMPFVIPTDDEIKIFHIIVKPMFEQILNNQLQNEKLATLQDTLLPKLMSGELNVSNVELKI